MANLHELACIGKIPYGPTKRSTPLQGECFAMTDFFPARQRITWTLGHRNETSRIWTSNCCVSLCILCKCYEATPVCAISCRLLGHKNTDECLQGPERASYSPSRSELYIHYPGEGATTDSINARNVLTYNVLYSTDSQIRVALAGEDRTDERGLPVTWDIVKITEREYCWRRSDWGVTECTIPRVRCTP